MTAFRKEEVPASKKSEWTNKGITNFR